MSSFWFWPSCLGCCNNFEYVNLFSHLHVILHIAKHSFAASLQLALKTLGKHTWGQSLWPLIRDLPFCRLDWDFRLWLLLSSHLTFLQFSSRFPASFYKHHGRWAMSSLFLSVQPRFWTNKWLPGHKSSESTRTERITQGCWLSFLLHFASHQTPTKFHCASLSGQSKDYFVPQAR
jgi:hypothetical protein